jgi:hypothetical protein
MAYVMFAPVTLALPHAAAGKLLITPYKFGAK